MLPDKESQRMWGEFGYEGTMCDRAIRSDNLEDFQECVRRGYMDKDSDVMGAQSIVDLCRKKKAVKCLAWARKEGWE